MTPTIYVIINKDLNMSPGKAAAQAVHAAMMLGDNSIEAFKSEYRRTVITLEGTTEQIKNIYNYLNDAGFDVDYYIDEGMNEVDAYSATALATFISEEKDKELFAGFKLYGKSVDTYEEDDYNTCESEQAMVNRTVYEISRQVNQMSIKIAQATQPKPQSAWRRFLTNRFKKNRSWVS